MNIKDLRIRDPFLLAENGSYYLTGTVNGGKDGYCEMFCGKTTEEFVSCGNPIDGKYLKGYTDLWAPELHKYKDKYYLIVSLYEQEKGRGSMIFVSERPDRGFVPLTGEYITPAGWGCLDATLFVQNGVPYLYFSNEWITPITNDGDGALFVARLSSDLKRIVSAPKKIVSGKYCGISTRKVIGPYEGYVAEGPFVYQEKTDIVLLWSTFTETGYSIVQSRSKTGVFGEYIFEKFLFTEDGGHCMVFETFNGERLLALHQPNVTPFERIRYFNMMD